MDSCIGKTTERSPGFVTIQPEPNHHLGMHKTHKKEERLKYVTSQVPSSTQYL